MIDLKGKRALVCGASKGIGFSIAKLFNELNAKVTLLSSNKDNLANALKELKYPEKAGYIEIDLNNYDNIATKIGKNTNYDILVNNSGGPAPGNIIGSNIEEFKKAIDSHLFASHTITKLLLPNMKKQNYGRIINIISISVKEPVENLGVSNTVRGAMNSWSKTLSKEVARYGITVNNILPGYTETDRLKSLFNNIASSQNKTYDEVKNKIVSRIPANRLGMPDDIAFLAAFLASEMSGYITGTNIPVDGGLLNGF
jgi:3-oxoacyl-[acyl-carrier protein] reductase